LRLQTPNGARRSPDASWIRKERIAALGPDEPNTFYSLCPDFVIERQSQTDRLPILQAKMREYLDNHATLAWLVDAVEKAVWIYRDASEKPVCMQQPAEVRVDGPVADFILPLAEIFG
jgi:Uma2 family endonuclease